MERTAFLESIADGCRGAIVGCTREADQGKRLGGLLVLVKGVEDRPEQHAGAGAELNVAVLVFLALEARLVVLDQERIDTLPEPVVGSDRAVRDATVRQRVFDRNGLQVEGHAGVSRTERRAEAETVFAEAETRDDER